MTSNAVNHESIRAAYEEGWRNRDKECRAQIDKLRVELASAHAEPWLPKDGTQWLDTSTDPPRLMVRHGDTWEEDRA